jgi:drug/metabolite transporter (DMT)-like permease
MLFSVIILFPILKITKSLKEIRHLKKKKWLLILGLVTATIWFTIYFSTTNTMIANAVFGFITSPIFVVLLSPFLLKENINRKIGIAFLISLVGIILIFDPIKILQSVISIGILAGILMGFSSGMNSIAGRKLKDDYSPYSLVFLGSLIGMIIISPTLFFVDMYIPNIYSILIIVLISIVGVSGGVAIFYSLKYIKAQSVSIILLLEPLISIIAALIIFSEIPSMLTILGGALLIVSDVIIIKNQK